MKVSLLAIFFSIVTLSLLMGCETVKPWQRDIAARKDMTWISDPLDAANMEHIYFSKEASSDPSASGGGGCGCN